MEGITIIRNVSDKTTSTKFYERYNPLHNPDPQINTTDLESKIAKYDAYPLYMILITLTKLPTRRQNSAI